MAKFKLTRDYLYWWPVTIDLPDERSPGKWVKQSITMRFVAVPSDEARRIAAEIAALPAAERDIRQHDQIIAASRDWRDVVDEDGQDVPFSEETLRQALQNSWFRAGIYNAYGRSLISDEARKGN